MTKEKELKNNPLALTGFILGLVSIFFSWIGIIPIAGLIISGIALSKFDPSKEKNKWQAIAGLILNFLYFLSYLNIYGYLNFQ